MSARKDFQDAIQRIASEYPSRQTVRLGRLDGVTVQTGIPGELWARQWNGKEIKVINRGMVPAIFDLRVLVGATKLQPTKWFTLIMMEDYLTPSGGGNIGYHERQHEFMQPDMLPIDRRQIINFTIMVYNAGLWQVQIYGGVFQGLTAMVLVPNQIADLSAYVTTAGAIHVGIMCDDTAALSYIVTANFESPAMGGAYIPQPPEGKYLIGYVLFYEGQTELSNNDIRVVMPLGVVSKTSGSQIHEAAADTPLDADEWGFWDVVDEVIKKITWANIMATLKIYFDTLYSALGHTHTSAVLKIVMGPDAIDPPVPVLTPDGDDYVYYEA